jgi:hypothetical protein
MNQVESEKLSSDIIPMEEDALCLEEDTLDCDSTEPLVELTAKEYLLKHSSNRHQVNVGDFALLSLEQKYEVVREVDE